MAKKKAPAFQYDVVLIRWSDSGTISDRWQDIEDLDFESCIECYTSGFLLDEKPDRLTIAGSIALNEDHKTSEVHMAITIPKSVITERRTLIHGVAKETGGTPSR